MTAWWESLTLLERVLACVAIPATLLLVIQMLLTLFGFGGNEAEAEGDAEVEADHELDFDDDIDDIDDGSDHDTHAGDHAEHDGHGGFSLRLFTLRGVTAFFAVYGWGALAISRAGHPWLAAILIGLVLGAAAMLLVAVVMALFVSLQTDGTVDYGNAVGLTGQVYLTVPPDRMGAGKVNVVIQEKLTECEAVTDEREPIATGQPVTVVGLTKDKQLIVIKS